MKKKYFSIGKILNTRGITGELKVQSWMDSLDDFCLVSKMFLDLNSPPLEIDNMRIYKSNVLLKIKSINSKEEAEKLKNKVIFAFREDIPLMKDRYFIEDLKGCTIIDSNNQNIYGILKDVVNNGAGDIYVIKNEKNREYLLPIIEGTIFDIDLDNENIYISPIEGVFDDN